MNNELISQLINDISNLKIEVKMIREKSVLTTQDSLVKLWDNEYDERWNQC